MTSPAATSVTRRRQRSTRLTVAVALLVVATLLVVGAIVAHTVPLLAVAAIGAVLLGAAAMRITQSELRDARRDANRDLAAQAKAYVALTTERIAENRKHEKHLADQAERDRRASAQTVAELEAALTAAHQRAAEALKSRTSETQRATAALARVAELERDLDVARAELDAAKVALKKVNEELEAQTAWRRSHTA